MAIRIRKTHNPRKWNSNIQNPKRGGGDGSYSDSFLIHQMDSPYSHIITVTDEMHCHNQCSGTVTFWCGSGSVNPYHGLPDPDPVFSLVTYDDGRIRILIWPTLTNGSGFRSRWPKNLRILRILIQSTGYNAEVFQVLIFFVPLLHRLVFYIFHNSCTKRFFKICTAAMYFGGIF